MIPNAKLQSLLGWLVQSRRLRFALTVAAIGALLLIVWQHRSTIGNTLATANLWLLGASTLLALFANYVSGLSLNSFLRQQGVRLPAYKACYLQLVAQIAKYIPGKVWSAVMQAQLTESKRIGPMLIAGIDNTLFMILCVTATGLALLAAPTHPAGSVALALSGWMIAAVIGSSAVLPRIIERILKVLGRNLPIRVPAIRRESGQLFLYAAFHALVQTASVVTLLMATTRYDTSDILIGAASILLAWMVGTVVVVIPSGLVVREAAFVYLATTFGVSADVTSLATIAIVARAAQTLPDILAAVLVSIVEGWRGAGGLRSTRPR